MSSIVDDCIDCYNLDNDNLILVLEHDMGDCYLYEMVHYRRCKDDFRMINRWEFSGFSFEGRDTTVCGELLIIDNKALYNFKNGEFVIPFGVFDSIVCSGLSSSGNYVDYFKRYGCFLGRTFNNFRNIFICSESDLSFFAIINQDGSIRDNSLFYGKSLSSIWGRINLFDYNGIEDIKISCSELGNKNSDKYLCVDDEGQVKIKKKVNYSLKMFKN